MPVALNQSVLDASGLALSDRVASLKEKRRLYDTALSVSEGLNPPLISFIGLLLLTEAEESLPEGLDSSIQQFFWRSHLVGKFYLDDKVKLR
ncbi:hypothetical protein [Nostoc sp. FACHB-133]|uniref:hypothetical protein n=1 Tax=Nostoc sp. FACHB-133 TaxID=2692835 RepID=UPI00168A0416|nr:hypothetical protein [Nostoc sp. FACHB-133]MBD2525010.1 hypothetical protein [Nostoc sp. FACHB-133]